MREVFFILLIVALGAVVATLGMGFYALFRGGQFGRNWSNRLMRLRILLQFAAILILGVGVLLFRQAR
jgi:hypothetical protein